MSPRARVLRGLIGLFFAGGLMMLIVFNSTKPRIMVVHSLSQESSWTGPVDKGIQAALTASRVPVSMVSDYLNLDLLSEDADIEAIASGVRRRIDAIDPHVLIVVDDETSNLIGRHYTGRAGMSVVYTGVLGDPINYGYGDSTRVVGIREILPLKAMNALLGYVHGSRPARIAVVGANTLTGLAEMQQALAHAWAPHEIVASESVPHFEAWKRFIDGPARAADVLIVLTMDHLARDVTQVRSVPEEEVAIWTARNATPLAIGIRTSYVRYGGALAVSAPPIEYGRAAVELALKRLIEPRFAPEGGSLTLDDYDLSMRLSDLERRGIELPGIYREAARGAGNLYR